MRKKSAGNPGSMAGGYACLFVTIFFFSTYEVVNKLIAGRIDPLQVNCLRFLVGGLVLFIVAAFKREVSVSRRDFGLCALAGVLNVVISMSLINLSLAMDGSSAAVCAVAFSCNPVFVSLFAALFDGENIGGRKIAALVLGVAGTALISFSTQVGGLGGAASPALAVLSAIVFALYTVLGKRVSSRIGSLRMNAWAFTTGGAILAVLLVAAGRPLVSFDYSIAGWVLYLSVFVTGLAYLAYFRGLTVAGAGKGSLVFFLKPALATAFAVVLLRESVKAPVLVGMALILCGIAFAVARGRAQSLR